MRVLRISHSAAVDEWRGRERALQDLGVDVTLLCATTEDVGGTTVTLRARPGENVTGVSRTGSHPALFVYDPRPLWRALGEHWDVVDIHEEPFALSTAEVLLLKRLRRNKAPVVLYTAQNLRKRYPIPFRWLERHALRSAAGVSACNSDAARIVEDKGFPGRARVIPLGVEVDAFGPSAHDHGGGDKQADRVTVGFVGRLVPEKGVSVLMDAASRDVRIHLRVVGDGPDAESLRQEARRRGIDGRVEFLGPMPPENVARFYSGIDVLAIPSLPTSRWTEQFGRVAVEAMASGTPVVSSDAGALPEVVAGAGIVVPRGDAGALAAALTEAAGPRAVELRAAGYVRASECSWDAVGREYLELYRAVRHEASVDESSLEIVVVAYGRPDLLRRALEPVAGMPVTVVDNSSLTEIDELCAELGVRYIDAHANLGFAGGVNRALADRLVPNADVLLLNPDARIDPGDIERLHQALRSDSRLASVAPAQIDEDGNAAQVTWLFPSPAKAWLEASGLSRLRRGATFVIGSVLLLRAEALAELGGLDERFFLYAEETDWAYRAHLRGWLHAEIAEVRAVHAGAATSSDERRREAHFHASQERYYRKHFGAAGWAIARAAVWVGSTLRGLVLPGERGSGARRRAALYRLGPARVEARLYSRGMRS